MYVNLLQEQEKTIDGESLPNTNPGMSPDFSSMTEPRKCDVIDKFYVGHLCENPPRDVLHTGCLIKDLSQNVDRGSIS